MDWDYFCWLLGSTELLGELCVLFWGFLCILLNESINELIYIVLASEYKYYMAPSPHERIFGGLGHFLPPCSCILHFFWMIKKEIYFLYSTNKGNILNQNCLH